jgi:hypothetical protein
MIDKITIPPKEYDNYCSIDCPFHHDDGKGAFCAEGLGILDELQRCSPGPECIPGEYALIQLGTNIRDH